jgi:type I restriction enzyme S subunit
MEYQTGTGVPVLTLSAVTGFEYNGSKVKLTSAPTEDGAHYWLRENDILITRSNTEELVGHVALYDGMPEKVICCDLIMKMQVDPAKADRRYVYYCLRSPLARRYLSSRAQGASPTMKKIGKAVVQDFPIPIRPLAEQQRIVAILDEAFDGIATAKANAEKNLQNTREVFESRLGIAFGEPGLGWVETTVGQCINFIDYRGKTPVKTAEGIRLITAKNVKMGFLQDSPMEFIANDAYDGWMTRGFPQMGDVLFTTEAPLANVAQLDTAEKVAFAQRIIIMQPDRKRLDNTFLKYLLLSGPVQQRIHEKGTGATVKGIKASLLRTIKIAFPQSIEEQRRHVETFDSLWDETQRLESLYRQKLAALDELKQSLLHRAFNGEL